MPDIIIVVLVAAYITGLVTCARAFMADYTAQVDFLFWLVMVALWPVSWVYILIRVRNDARARRELREAHLVHTGSPCEHCGRRITDE